MPGTWYYVEIVFLPGNTVVGRPFDAPGATPLLAVTYTYPSSNDTGGMALRSFGDGDIDTIQVCDGAN